MNKIQFCRLLKGGAIAASLAVLMTGCGIYSSYTRPDDLQVDGIYGDAGPSAAAVATGATTVADTTSIADIAWRDFFTDPYLQRLIDSVLARNADMRIAFLRVEESEASLKAAKLAFIPSFGLPLSGGVNGSMTFNDGGTQSSGVNYTYQLPLSASWQVDLFGGLRNAKKQAQAGLLQSQAYRQAVRTQLIANTALLYYQLLTLDEQLNVYILTEQSWAESLEATRALMQAGVGNTAAVAQSEGAYYRICASIPEIKQQIRETENRICALLGTTPRHIERGPMPTMIFANDLRVGIPLSLLSKRPDVMQAEQNLARAFYVTNAARSAFYPSLSLSGLIGWSNASGAIANPGGLIWNALANLTQPLFQNGKLRAQLKIAKAQQEEAKISFQQTLLEAGIEVNNALALVQTTREKTSLYDKQIASLEVAAESTRLLMEHGSTTYLEVLAAQQSLLTAQLTALGNRLSEWSAVVTLYRALGGGRM
ncbi:MAG: TolC family protein [Bacteroidales bacterium]|nr:TolC family protein [Bacteroidales bacterium]